MKVCSQLLRWRGILRLEYTLAEPLGGRPGCCALGLSLTTRRASRRKKGFLCRIHVVMQIHVGFSYVRPRNFNVLKYSLLAASPKRIWRISSMSLFSLSGTCVLIQKAKRYLPKVTLPFWALLSQCRTKVT